MVGEFTPWKSANTANQEVSPSWRASNEAYLDKMKINAPVAGLDHAGGRKN